MKLILLTLHNVNNYGSVLQAYASQQIFESLGYECPILDYYRKTNEPECFFRLLMKPSISFSKKKQYIRCFLGKSNKSDKVFTEFRRKYLHLTAEKYFGDKSVYDKPPVADVFISGSDQIWNPYYAEGIPFVFLGGFVPEGSRKIAFASSFGVEEIPSQLLESYRSFLQKYSAISVRESSAINILNSLNIKSSLVLDPVLIVDPSMWESMSSERIINEEYILVYNVSHSDGMADYALRYAKKHRLKLVRICNDKFEFIRERTGMFIFYPRPEEFISLIKYATYIITNSYHCILFSLIFNKHFLIVPPKKYLTRIDNILDIVDLNTTPLVQDFYNLTYGEEKYNYTKINNILQSKREESYSILKNMLRLENS